MLFRKVVKKKKLNLVTKLEIRSEYIAIYCNMQKGSINMVNWNK